MNKTLVVFLVFVSFLYLGIAVEDSVTNCSYAGSNYTNESKVSDCVPSPESYEGAAAPMVASNNVDSAEKGVTDQPESPAAKFNEWIPLGALAIVLVLAAFVVFSVLMKKPVIDDVETYKALSSDTRVDIMNELSQGARIPTDLSSRLGKSKSTIVEHLDKLIEAELVERIEEPGKKFVFYRLTSKGRSAVRAAA